jgi:hypothetical protein
MGTRPARNARAGRDVHGSVDMLADPALRGGGSPHEVLPPISNAQPLPNPPAVRAGPGRGGVRRGRRRRLQPSGRPGRRRAPSRRSRGHALACRARLHPGEHRLHRRARREQGAVRRAPHRRRRAAIDRAPGAGLSRRRPPRRLGAPGDLAGGGGTDAGGALLGGAGGDGPSPPAGTARRADAQPQLGAGRPVAGLREQHARRVSRHLPAGPGDGAGASAHPEPGRGTSGPVVSPRGDWVVFGSSRDSVSELYRMRPDGSRQERITRTPRDEWGSALVVGRWPPRLPERPRTGATGCT